MELEQKIISFHEYFNSRVMGVEASSEVSGNEMFTVRSFIYDLSEDVHISSIGNDWLFHYFCFQFSYWEGLDTGYSKRVQMTWVLGSKAYDRWKDRREDYRFLNEMFAIDQGISKSELIEITGQSELRDYRDLRDIEDVERDRYHNEDEGFAHCVLTTTMCDDESELCKSCKFSDDCKEVLRIQHPKIYRQRGYARRKTIEF